MLIGTEDDGFGHMMFINGFDEDGLIVVNSYGLDAGKEGKHRMARETINYFASRYGVFMMIDMSPEKDKQQIRRADWSRADW